MTGRLLSAVTDAAAATHDNGSVVVTEYIVLASFIDGSGERNVYCDTIEDQTCSQSLGLLAFGMALENHRAVEPD